MAKYLFNCTSVNQNYAQVSSSDVTEAISSKDDWALIPFNPDAEAFSFTTSFTSKTSISTSGNVTLNFCYQKFTDSKLYVQINGNNIYEFNSTHNIDDDINYLTDVKVDVTQYVINGQKFSFNLYCTYPNNDNFYVYSIDHIELETDSSGSSGDGGNTGGGNNDNTVEVEADGDILSISKAGTVLGSIWWNSPSIPNNTIVTSYKLYGSVSVNVSRGTINNITVNDELVYDGEEFEIDLGTDLSLIMVETSATGSKSGSKNPSGSVEFHDLRVEVKYREEGSSPGGGNIGGGTDNPSDDPSDDVGGNVPFDGTITIFIVKNRSIGKVPRTHIPIYKSVYDNGDGTSTITITGNEEPEWLDFQPYEYDLIEIKKLYTNSMNIFTFMFTGCSDLISLNSSKWYGPNVSSFYGTFDNCTSLTSIDLGNLRPVCDGYDFDAAFSGCYELREINLSNFANERNSDSQPYVNEATFYDCYSLNTIYFYNTDTVIINALIDYLPDRNEVYEEWPGSGQPGTLYVSSLQGINVSEANRLNWNVSTDLIPGKDGNEVEENKITIVEYKFNNASNDLLPEFNDGYIYDYKDVNNGDGTITRTIESDTLPTQINFNGATNLLEILYLDFSNITDASNMFNGCTNLTNINGINDWDVSKVTTMYMMFTSCSSLIELDLSNWNPSSLTTMYGMFYRCSKLQSLKLGQGNTPVLESIEGMFNNCLVLSNIDFGGLNVSNVNNMGGVFSDCRKVTNLDIITDWDVSNVTNFGAMFRRCYAIEELDLSNWDVSLAGNITTMFEGCTSLTTLNLNNWHLNEEVSTTGLFSTCNELTSIQIENSDAITVNKIIEHLPTKSENSLGSISITGVDDLSQINISEAQAKYWNYGYKSPEVRKLKLQGIDIGKLFLGLIPIKKVYLGDNLVFSKNAEHSPAAEIKTENIEYDIGTETVFEEDSDYIDTGVDLFEPNNDWSVLIDFDDKGYAEDINSLFILHNFYEGPNGELQGFNIQKTGNAQGHRLSFQVNDHYYATKSLEDGTNTRLVITFKSPGTLKMYYNDPDIDAHLNSNGCFQFDFGEFHDIEGCNLHLACWYNESQGGVGRFWRGIINEFTTWTETALTEQEALYVLNNKKEDTNYNISIKPKQ